MQGLKYQIGAMAEVGTDGKPPKWSLVRICLFGATSRHTAGKVFSGGNVDGVEQALCKD
jgi:hypothetical protein